MNDDTVTLEDALDGFTADLDSHPIQGFLHDGRAIDVPLASRITENLWVGGWPGPLTTQKFASKVKPLKLFAAIVDVYGHAYDVPAGPIYVRKPLADWQGEPPAGIVALLASYVALAVHNGPVLVHCQAGLNRSSLIAAASMTLSGMPVAEAIELLRARRSPLCLCNDAFESWLLHRYAFDDACPMCGWAAGTNAASCGECASR